MGCSRNIITVESCSEEFLVETHCNITYSRITSQLKQRIVEEWCVKSCNGAISNSKATGNCYFYAAEFSVKIPVNF